jgi:hypothetical protein
LSLPLCCGVEFADLGKDLGQPVGEPIEAAPRKAFWQGSPEHLDCMLGEQQSIGNTIEAGARATAEGRGFPVGSRIMGSARPIA